ncbi:MAG: glycerate kinase, partial [Chloroflexi bacterium]
MIANLPPTVSPVVVCAPNAFKGTLTAAAAAAAMARGVAHRSAVPRLAPVADGGDGTLDVLLLAAGSSARLTRHGVTGPLGGRVTARLGWLGSDVAVVELAEASGLRLLRSRSLDALRATSCGTGELLRAAL